MLPVLLLIIAMISIQFGASLAKGLFPMMGPFGATAIRLIFAASLLLLYWRPWKFKLLRANYLMIALYGAALGGMNLFFYLSLERIPLGIAVALEFLGPLGVAIFSSQKKSDLVWAFLAFVGIVLLLQPGAHAVSELDIWGAALAITAGLFWAVYIIFGQRVGLQVPAGVATSLGMFCAAVLIAPLSLGQVPLAVWQFSYLPLGLGVAIFSSIIPYSLEMVALKQLPRKTFSVLMSLEPVIGALMGLFLLQEVLDFNQWVGILLVGMASAGSARSFKS